MCRNLVQILLSVEILLNVEIGEMSYIKFVVLVFLFLATMPRPHPRLQRGAHLLDDISDVRDWAPPGWHWEVSPSGGAQLGEDSGSRR